MKHGDLSNEVIPRIVIVFEGALGFIMDENDRGYRKLVKKEKWDEAIKYWKLNQSALGKIWYLFAKKSVVVDVCTWMPEGMANAIADELDANHIPVQSVWSSRPDILARELAYLPDIALIYDPDEDHVFSYGRKGRLLRDVNEIGEGI